MRVTTGKVMDGKIVIEGESLTEGATVTVLAPEDSQTFELDPVEEAQLLEAIDQMRRGDFVDADELLREIRS